MWLPFCFFNLVSDFKGTLGHITNLNDCKDIFSNRKQSLGLTYNQTKGGGGYVCVREEQKAVLADLYSRQQCDFSYLLESVLYC